MTEQSEKKDYFEKTELEQQKCQEVWLRNFLLIIGGSFVICILLVYFFGCRPMAGQ